VFYALGTIIFLVLAGIVVYIGITKMNRPKCPSCGLSVDRGLDKCPYCHAHMHA
jgi:hypothetical protein